MDIDLQKEKLEEMRRDMIEEQKIREDFNYAIDTISSKYDLPDAVNEIRKFIKEMETYNWSIDIEEVFDWY